ncbi:MAG: helix-turn-helix transcriptional regulator, partial [Vicinamibacteria bacterium]
MNSARKTRLKTKGWRSGSAAEFLALSPEESYFVELKLKLADELKLRRVKRRISQQELATLVGSSQSRVAKMERGDASV